MSGYTRLSALIWEWDPFVNLSYEGRNLWLALYTSPQSKRLFVPGLFHGSVQAMASEARMPTIDAAAALRLLIDHDLVEYDQAKRVLRLTELPDAGEWPFSPSIIASWWKHFQNVPECQVRDAHIPVLRWLIDQGARTAAMQPKGKNRSGNPSPAHEEEWATTFGMVQVPLPRKRGVRSLDPVQRSLFDTLPEINHLESYPPPTQVGKEKEKEKDLSSDLSSTSHATSETLAEDPPPYTTPFKSIPLPPDLPFSVADMLTALASESSGRVASGPVDERLLDALCATIRSCAAADVGVSDLRTVGAWIASGGLSYRTDLGPTWASKPGNVIDAVALARAWSDRGRGGVGGRRDLRVEPAPLGAHGTGRRKL